MSQTTHPDLEVSKIPAVTEAARKYNKVKKQRMKLTDKEVEAKKKLDDALREANVKLTAFEDEDGEVRYAWRKAGETTCGTSDKPPKGLDPDEDHE